MKEHLINKARDMDLARELIRMEVHMKVNTKMTILMASVSLSGKMERSMMENG